MWEYGTFKTNTRDAADSLSLDEQGDLRLHLQVLLGHLAVLLEHSHGLFGVGTGSEGLQTDAQASELGDFKPRPLVHCAGCIYNGCSVWSQQITARPAARRCARIYTTGSIFRQHHVFRGNPLVMKLCLMNYRVCRFSYQKDQAWGQRLIQWSFALLVTLNVMRLSEGWREAVPVAGDPG